MRLYDGDGMYLVVQPQGGRSWRFDYRFQGTRKGISLGTYPEVSLAVARERRAEARRLVAEGLDPSRVRQAAKRGTAEGHTFDAVAAEWLARQATKWAASTTEKATYHLSLPSPWIGRRPIGSIEPPELLDVLRDIEGQGHIETAHNVKQRVGQVFRYPDLPAAWWLLVGAGMVASPTLLLVESRVNRARWNQWRFSMRRCSLWDIARGRHIPELR